jgi:hypothetical protein
VDATINVWIALGRMVMIAKQAMAMTIKLVQILWRGAIGIRQTIKRIASKGIGDRLAFANPVLQVQRGNMVMVVIRLA